MLFCMVTLSGKRMIANYTATKIVLACWTFTFRRWVIHTLVNYINAHDTRLFHTAFSNAAPASFIGIVWMRGYDYGTTTPQ
jgi:hypothetical protein